MPAGGESIGRGLRDTFWPLAALALMTLMLVRACVPAQPAATARFDQQAAAAEANRTALAALRALPADAGAPQLAGALNRLVINFESGSAELPAESREALQLATAKLAAMPATLTITGHTDRIGEAGANRILSRQRAQAVRAALIEFGVPAERLIAEGAGDTQPVADNSTEAGRFRNRRIAFGVQP